MNRSPATAVRAPPSEISKRRTAGLGPVLSFGFKLGKVDMIAEAKWLHELETRNRLEGDIVWFKLVAKF